MTMEIAMAMIAVSAPVTMGIFRIPRPRKNGVVSPVEFAEVKTTLDFIKVDLDSIKAKLNIQ